MATTWENRQTAIENALKARAVAVARYSSLCARRGGFGRPGLPPPLTAAELVEWQAGAPDSPWAWVQRAAPGYGDNAIERDYYEKTHIPPELYNSSGVFGQNLLQKTWGGVYPLENMTVFYPLPARFEATTGVQWRALNNPPPPGPAPEVPPVVSGGTMPEGYVATMADIIAQNDRVAYDLAHPEQIPQMTDERSGINLGPVHLSRNLAASIVNTAEVVIPAVVAAGLTAGVGGLIAASPVLASAAEQLKKAQERAQELQDKLKAEMEAAEKSAENLLPKIPPGPLDGLGIDTLLKGQNMDLSQLFQNPEQGNVDATGAEIIEATEQKAEPYNDPGEIDFLERFFKFLSELFKGGK